MENHQKGTEKPEHTNIQFIYNYTENRMKLVNDSINALNTKLGSIIAFSGAAIGFSINLPNKAFITTDLTESSYLCYLCLNLKIFLCVFLVIAIFTSTYGFVPKAGGAMTPPSLLMEENYYDSDEDIRLIITKTWIEALAELELLRDNKAKLVTRAILAFGGAAVLAAFDVILASILSML